MASHEPKKLPHKLKRDKQFSPGLRLSRPWGGVKPRPVGFHGFISWFHQPIDFNKVPFGAVQPLQTSRRLPKSKQPQKSWLKVLLFIYLRGLLEIDGDVPVFFSEKEIT